jgi:hypothetical protein
LRKRVGSLFHVRNRFPSSFTFASLLLRLGRPAIEVVGLMDHSSVDITHWVYAHFDPATRDGQAADVLSDAIFGNTKTVEERARDVAIERRWPYIQVITAHGD